MQLRCTPLIPRACTPLIPRATSCSATLCSGKGERSPGADVAGMSLEPVPVQMRAAQMISGVSPVLAQMMQTMWQARARS